MTEPTRPLFMNPELPLIEPKLDPATIVLGSEVIVVIPSYSRKTLDRQILTKVIKRGRVWITVETAEETARKGTWDLRLDTQHDGKDSNYRVHFYTFAQYAYREARNAAYQFLNVEQGIRTESSSPWHRRSIELARIIWQAQNKEEVQDVNDSTHDQG